MQSNKKIKLDIDNSNLWSYLAIEIVYYILVDLAGFKQLNRACYKWSLRHSTFKRYTSYRLGNSRFGIIMDGFHDWTNFLNDKYAIKRVDSVKKKWSFNKLLAYMQDTNLRQNGFVCFYELIAASKVIPVKTFEVFRTYDKKWNLGNMEASPVSVDFNMLVGLTFISLKSNTRASFGKFSLLGKQHLMHALDLNVQDFQKYMIYLAMQGIANVEMNYWLKREEEVQIKKKDYILSKKEGKNSMQIRADSSVLVAQVNIDKEVNFRSFTNLGEFLITKDMGKVIMENNRKNIQSSMQNISGYMDNIVNTNKMLDCIKALKETNGSIKYDETEKKAIKMLKAMFLDITLNYVVLYLLHMHDLFYDDSRDGRIAEIRFRLKLLSMCEPLAKRLNARAIFKANGTQLGYQQL